MGNVLTQRTSIQPPHNHQNKRRDPEGKHLSVWLTQLISLGLFTKFDSNIRNEFPGQLLLALSHLKSVIIIITDYQQNAEMFESI